MTTPHTPFGAFLALTFEDKLFENFQGVSKEVQDSTFQNLLITLREDGYFGYLGGGANPGETELECLARECMEEGGVDTSKLELTRVCEHMLHDNFLVVLYHAKITKQQAREIIANSAMAEHFFTETAGLCSVALHDKTRFYRNNFLSSVKQQFVELGKLIKSDVLVSWGDTKP